MRQSVRQFRVRLNTDEGERLEHFAAAGRVTPSALIRAIVRAKLYEVRQLGRLELDLGKMEIHDIRAS